MPYNQSLAQRIQAVLGERPGLSEKKMFGGVGFMINGNMACGAQGDELIVRVGVENNDLALAQPGVRPFPAPGGKPMAGWVLVSPEVWMSETELQKWVEQGVEYARTIPEKK